jgi:siroheme synthase (precorrin-2 oxidase/ferrochelatase)
VLPIDWPVDGDDVAVVGQGREAPSLRGQP